jgi:multiple sugar transport system substrate-binding protein
MSKHYRLTRRDFLIGTGAALTGTVLAACGPAATEAPAAPTEAPAAPTEVPAAPTEAPAAPTEAPAAPTEPVTVRVAYWATEAHMVGYNKVVDAFHDHYPDITFEVVIPPVGEYLEKLLAMYAGGEGTDILYTPGYWFPTFLSKGILRDVQDYVERDGWDSSIYVSQALDSFRSEGKVYGIPWVWHSINIFWNKTMFDDLGVDYPATSLDDHSWTWDKFVEVCKALTTRDDSGALLTVGYNLPLKAWYWYRTVVWGAGGEVISEDMDECLINSPECVEAIQWAVDLQRVHEVLPTVAGGAWTEIPTFETGVVGMDLNAAPRISGWWELDFEWDVAHNPIGPAGQSGVLSPEGFVMSNVSEHPDQAWEVLKFLGTPEAQEIQAGSARSNPAVQSVFMSDKYIPAGKPPEHKEVLWESLEYLREPYYPPFWAEMNTIIINELEPCFYEGRDVQEATDSICEQVEELIAEA